MVRSCVVATGQPEKEVGEKDADLAQGGVYVDQLEGVGEVNLHEFESGFVRVGIRQTPH